MRLYFYDETRSSRKSCSMKKLFLKISQYSQAFSCKYCKIFKNTSLEEDLRTAASDQKLIIT